jgi:membrane-associated phospholipid phosphatase
MAALGSEVAVGAVRLVEEGLLQRVRPGRRGRRTAVVISQVTERGGLWVGLSAASLPTPRRRAGIEALAGWALGSLAAQGVKPLVRRQRPSIRGRSGPAPRTSSMPSSHTAGAFGYATAASLAAPAVAPAAVGLAAAVAWSRAATGRHFPTDVAVGAALGVLAGTAVHVAAGRVRPTASDERPISAHSVA